MKTQIKAHDVAQVTGTAALGAGAGWLLVNVLSRIVDLPVEPIKTAAMIAGAGAGVYYSQTPKFKASCKTRG